MRIVKALLISGIIIGLLVLLEGGISSAYNTGLNDGYRRAQIDYTDSLSHYKQYYNETYGKANDNP